MGFLETLDIEEVSIGEVWESCLNFNYPMDFVLAREALADHIAQTLGLADASGRGGLSNSLDKPRL